MLGYTDFLLDELDSNAIWLKNIEKNNYEYGNYIYNIYSCMY